jgi:hypothetical protein
VQAGLQAAAAAVLEESLTTKSVPALVRTLSPGRLPRFTPAEVRKVGIAFEQDTAGMPGLTAMLLVHCLRCSVNEHAYHPQAALAQHIHAAFGDV